MEVAVIPATLELRAEELKPWLEEEIADVLKPLNEQGKKLVDKLKDRLDDARGTCEKLEEEGKKQLEKGKAVRKAKVTQKLSRYFLKQIDKTAIPDRISFTELNMFHEDLEKMFSYVARERSAWFRRISPLFIIARKRVDFAFSRLAGSMSELGAFLITDYSKAEAAEKLHSETDELMRLLDELDENERRIAGSRSKAQLLQKNIENSEQTIESVKGSAELSDLDHVETKMAQLEKQVRHDLRHLQKPFKKFTNLSRGPGYSLSSEEVEKLSQYSEEPLVALATEKSGYPTLKNILIKIDRAIAEGVLKLKSSRARKAREEINTILHREALGKLHQDCAQAFSSSRHLVSSEETVIAQRKLRQEQRRLDELRRQREATDVRLNVLEGKHKQLLEKVKEKKQMLEKSVYSVLDKHVDLKF